MTVALQLPELNVVHQAHVLDFFGALSDGCIQCVVTSPPYWGLRVYGTPPMVWPPAWPPDSGLTTEDIEERDAVWRNCEHEWGEAGVIGMVSSEYEGSIRPGRSNPRGHVRVLGTNRNFIDEGGRGSNNPSIASESATCSKCGAWRGHYGLEPTIDLYVEHTVMWMRALRPKLRDDGTVWLNLGDSYASGKGTCFNPGGGETSLGQARKGADAHPLDRGNTSVLYGMGLKPKDLVMMPARVALALQADGWWLRSDIVWAKPNPMPESVTDRPTKAHEYVFLLSKAKHYLYDADAVREVAETTSWPGVGPQHGAERQRGEKYEPMAVHAGRNLRSVWHLPTQPYPGAHFATYPQKLVERCILAGSSAQACPACGAPWERVVDVSYEVAGGRGAKEKTLSGQAKQQMQNPGPQGMKFGRANKQSTTLGFRPTCSCEPNDGSGNCIVCDPFAGTATTGVVAIKHGRDFLGCDLMGGDKDFEKGPGGVEHHTANDRLAAASKGLTLRDYLQGQGSLWKGG